MTTYLGESRDRNGRGAIDSAPLVRQALTLHLAIEIWLRWSRKGVTRHSYASGERDILPVHTSFVLEVLRLLNLLRVFYYSPYIISN